MVDTISGVTMHVTTPQMLLLLHFVYVKHKKKITDRKVNLILFTFGLLSHFEVAERPIIQPNELCIPGLNTQRITG